MPTPKGSIRFFPNARGGITIVIVPLDIKLEFTLETFLQFRDSVVAEAARLEAKPGTLQ